MEDTYTTGVVLSETERKIVETQAEKLGLGARGFSAALRIIVREWSDLTGRKPQAEDATHAFSVTKP